MAAIPNYAATKKSVLKVESFNKKSREDSVKWCRLGRKKAEELIKKIESSAKETSILRTKIDALYLKWTPVAEVLAELQGDLAKAKKKKSTAEIKEIKKKMQISEKDYNTHKEAITKLYDQEHALAVKLYAAAKKLEKI